MRSNGEFSNKAPIEKNDGEELASPSSNEGGERPNKEPFSRIWIFEDSDRVKLFRNGNNKVAVTIALEQMRTLPINCLRDTNTGASLIREVLLSDEFLSAAKYDRWPYLRSATNHKLAAFSTTMLHLKMGNAGDRVVLGVMKQMAVAVLLGISLFDMCVWGKIPGKLKRSSRKPKLLQLCEEIIMLHTLVSTDIYLANTSEAKK